MKTQAEIEALKANWVADPCWDLEDTEGFEDHRTELLRYATMMHHEWDTEYKRREERRVREMEMFAEHLGIPGNTVLMAYLQKMREDYLHQIALLERRVEYLESQS